MKRMIPFVLSVLSSVSFASAQKSNEATTLLQQYVAIDTSNPPGDTRKTADFLTAIFRREGIPVTRYESAAGKSIVYARLKATVSPPAGKRSEERRVGKEGRAGGTGDHKRQKKSRR